ncbi:MAG: hypothetical protein AB7K71_23575 [Polyangiaceae bacterium]
MCPTAGGVTLAESIRHRGAVLRSLELAIRGYRRWGSGKGPLRRVRCSFEQTESCSAFGLRMSREAASARTALRLIRARIAACGDGCVHVPVGSMKESARKRTEPKVYWGPLYDRLDAAESQELLSRELPSTRAAMSRASSLAQHPKGHRLSSDQLRQLLGSPRVILRAGTGEPSRQRRLYITAGIWLLCVIALLLLAKHFAWFWVLSGLVLALGGRATWRAYVRLDAWRERREEQRAAAQFELFRLE